MQEEPIRILQVVNIMDRAGIETMLMNYYRNINRNKIQFDFLMHRKEKGAYDDEIKSLGGRIYHAPRLYPQNYRSYYKYMKSFFDNNKEYKIIHSHIDAMSAFPLYAAQKAKIPVRIGHSHSTQIVMDFKYPIKKIAKFFVAKFANIYCACGKEAGKFLFKDNEFKIINNVIDVEKFKFDLKIRNKVRKELNIENDFVIGNVGRFNTVKNQMFLIDIVKDIATKENNVKLLLIGKGEEERKLKEKVSRLGLENNVIFLIDRSDVNELYQAMDVFVMPSLFEGIPVVGIEAQTNGLPCFFSTNIPNEIIISSKVKMMNLSLSHKDWADEILKTRIDSSYIRGVNNVTVDKFNAKKEAIKLEEWYMNLFKEVSNESCYNRT